MLWDFEKNRDFNNLENSLLVGYKLKWLEKMACWCETQAGEKLQVRNFSVRRLKHVA